MAEEDNRCCYLFDLATGSHLILILEIVLYIRTLTFMTQVDVGAGGYYLVIVETYISLGSAILGLTGVSQRRPNFLGPFLLTSIITFFFRLALIYEWPHLIFLPDLLRTADTLIERIVSAMVFATIFGIYSRFILVVRTYTMQLLKEEKEAKKNANQNTTSVLQS